MRSSSGRPKARVLPEPVLALPSTSRPARRVGDGEGLDGEGLGDALGRRGRRRARPTRPSASKVVVTGWCSLSVDASSVRRAVRRVALLRRDDRELREVDPRARMRLAVPMLPLDRGGAGFPAGAPLLPLAAAAPGPAPLLLARRALGASRRGVALALLLRFGHASDPRRVGHPSRPSTDSRHVRADIVGFSVPRRGGPTRASRRRRWAAGSGRS